MKKVLMFTTLVLTTVTLASCSLAKNKSSNSDGSTAVGNGKVEMKIKDGQYVLPSDSDSDSKYLALNIEIKNKGDKKLTLSNTDFGLYNSDDEKEKPVTVYDSTEKFNSFSYDSVSKGKSVKGYIVFEVDKDEKYELHYSPTIISTDDKDSNEIQVKVDPSKYTDDVDKAEELASEYVNSVFLSGEASGNAENVSVVPSKTSPLLLADDKKSDKDSKDDKKKDKSFTLGGDVKKDRSEFTKKFASDFGDEFSYYHPSEAELSTFIAAYTKANAKRAKITYKVSEYLPEHVVIYVRPEVIGLENLRTGDLITKFANEHRGEYSNYSDALSAAEKYIIEQAPTQFDTLPLVTNKYMDSEGYKIEFTKKSGKWVINTSGYNYESLSEAFQG
ncbi:MAG: DUF4352 domain-containing protein [Streptococcus sp.]|nr:DUF4352 domain-containing protein [Streptococcus sp.]